MDPFDEFEFKPLTEGLGFHKKSVQLKDEVKKAELSEPDFPVHAPREARAHQNQDPRPRPTYEDLMKSLESEVPGRREQQGFREIDLDSGENESRARVKISSPLPRTGEQIFRAEPEMEYPVSEPSFPPPTEAPRQPRQDSPRPVIKPAPNENRISRGAHGAGGPTLKPASISLSSAFLDLLVISALSLLFLMSLMLVTEADIVSVILNAQLDIAAQAALAIMCLAILQMYVVISRSFFGRTLGEWTFDLQIGSDEQQQSSLYPLRVVWRSILTTVTGLFLLPLISALFNTDVAGWLSGVRLYRHS